MKKTIHLHSLDIKKILKIILPLALGGFLVWYSLADISLKTLGTYFKEANYGFIMLGLFFGILSHLSRAYDGSLCLNHWVLNRSLQTAF